MIDLLLPDCESIRGTFREWQAEHESLDAQLSESLAALAAYQSHLDAWQQQLARARTELQSLRNEFERQRADEEQSRSHLQLSAAASEAELNAARNEIAKLHSGLLERAEETRAADQRRADLAAELEQARAKEQELNAALDEQRRLLEVERTNWAEESQRLRELAERRPEAGAATAANVVQEPQETSAAPRSASQNPPPEQHSESPVLASIMQQFGKLRQQRANDREALRKSR
jgi:chromosome segregation ATPase